MAQSASSASQTLTAGQRQWLGHLRACEAQGCSSAAYAREHGLSVRALYTARKELTLRGVFNAGRRRHRAVSQSPVTLIPIQMSGSAPVSTSSVNAGCVLRVLLPTGVVIEVPEQTEPGRCQALVAALSRAVSR